MKKITIILLMLVLLTACKGKGTTSNTTASNKTSTTVTNSGTTNNLTTAQTSTKIVTTRNIVIPSDYDATAATEITLANLASSVSNNNGGVEIIENTIYIYTAGEYDIVGTLDEGNIIVSAGEEDKVTLSLQGVEITSSLTAPISALSGDKIYISAQNGTINTLNDRRITALEDEPSGCLYAEIDMNIKGKGTLNVNTTYNNGIHTKDDLEIKNAIINVEAVNNAIKGNDSVTIESGTITAISTLGDAIKTDNSDISSSGNQRGTITILDGILNLYAACDAIDASYDVIISGGTINCLTEQFSSYSGDVTSVSDEVMYIKFSSQNRPGAMSFAYANYSYCCLFTLANNTTLWEDASLISNTSSFNSSIYYSVSKPSDAISMKIYAYSATQEKQNLTSYSYVTDNLNLNENYDTYNINSYYGTTLSGGWTNYTTMGGMEEGNSDKADYSCKGVKADNQIIISGGDITIKAHDDAIHANGDNLLETEIYGVGNITISGGNLNIYSNDDGIHADGILDITGGEITITNSYEGIEGATININGGNISLMASDDGINAKTAFNVNGGILYVNANGDGLDSNGTINMTGGVVLVLGPSASGNGVLDFDSTFKISGGLLLAIGSSDMRQNASATGNALVSSKTISSAVNSYVNISIDGTVCAVLKVKKSNTNYCAYGYDKTIYGVTATITVTTSTSYTLINDSYYIE